MATPGKVALKVLNATGKTAGHVLTVQADGTVDAAAPSGSAVPNVSNWGANTESISADKTLTDASPAIQILTPTVAGLRVILPTITTSTPFFQITNPWGSLYGFTVRSAAGINMRVVSPGKTALVTTDGTSILVSVVDVQLEGRGLIPMHFSASMSNVAYNGRYMYASRDYTGSVPVTPQSVATDITVPVDGTLTYLTWDKQFASTTADIKIVVNGTPGSAIDISAINGYTSISVAVSAGDVIAIETDTLVGSWSASQVSLWLVPTSGGYVCRPFGNTVPSAAGWYCASGGSAYTAGIASISPYTDYVIPTACDLEAVSFRTTTAATTAELAVYKNGSLVETIAFGGGTSGVITGWTTSFDADDLVSFRITVQSIGATALLVAFSGSAKSQLPFFGKCGTTVNYWLTTTYAPTNAGDADGAPTYLWRHRAPAALVVTGMTVYGVIVNPVSLSFSIMQNGVVVGNVTGSLGSGGGHLVLDLDVPILFSRGDDVGLVSVNFSNLTYGLMEIQGYIL